VWTAEGETIPVSKIGFLKMQERGEGQRKKTEKKRDECKQRLAGTSVGRGRRDLNGGSCMSSGQKGDLRKRGKDRGEGEISKTDLTHYYRKGE